MIIDYLLIVALVVSLILRSNTLLIVFGIAGVAPVLISAVKSLLNKKINVDLLASIALIVSILHHEWVSVAFINLMITSARIFALYTENRARHAIASLLKLRPTTVKIKQQNSIIEIAIDQVKSGMEVIIQSGERIPVDGQIITGYGEVDCSSLTGESLPLHKAVGDQVLSSTLNLAGSFIVRADKVGANTQFAKIIQLMEEAQSQKTPVTTTIDRFTTWYILATFFVTTLLYLATRNLNLVLSLLLVTCADDIAVAIPLTYWGAIARAATKGIIIKGSSYLEGLGQITTLLVDKTGTLTRGQIKVSHITPIAKTSHDDIVKIAASIESVSSHPLAKAIVRYAESQHLSVHPPSSFNEVPGFGLTATLNKNKIVAGKIEFIKQNKIPITSEVLTQINLIESEGHNIVIIAKNRQVIGLIGLGDEIKPGVKMTITKLRNLGVSQVVMLTGDNLQVATTVAAQTGITQFHADLLPGSKLDYVKKYLNPLSKVGFVGDGVNDSASIGLADIGFAMGAIGSDSAIEAADIALMDDKFIKIYDAIKLSRFTLKIARQDFIIWGTVNLLGLFLVFTGVLNPASAAAYNFITDFFPLLNSVRVFKYRF